MDARLFDTLSRMVSTAGSRRHAAMTAVGGVLALLGLAEPPEVAAKKKCPPCKKRNKQGKCKKKKPDGTSCGSGGACQGGSCVCPGGTEACGGACVARFSAGTARNPFSCTCCQPGGQTCSPSGPNNCCVGSCLIDRCGSQRSGEPCTFAAECGTKVCNGGVCACSALREPCLNNFDCCDATTGLAGTVLCDVKVGFSGGVCCASNTAPCATSADCCGSLTCSGGKCG